jgi:site-specific recombinase XerD
MVLQMKLNIILRKGIDLNRIYLSCYRDWLAKQGVSPNTARAYYSRAKQFLLFLDYAELGLTSIEDAASMNEAVSAYLNFLKLCQKKNSTLNANLNALKSFAQFIGVDVLALKRAPEYHQALKLLTVSEQQRFTKAIDEQALARDRALALMLCHTGLRLGDCAGLNLQDVGAGAASLHLAKNLRVPLNETTTMALRQWLLERQEIANDSSEPGLWLTQEGKRLSASGINYVIARIGWQAKLMVSVEALRRSFLSGVAETMSKNEIAERFGGYISRATLKRYGINLP